MEDNHFYPSIVLEHIINNLPCHIYWQDLNGKILGCNQRQAESLGYECIADVVGKTPYELLPAREAKAHMSTFHKVIQTGESISLEETATYRNQTLSVISQKIPLRDKNNNIMGISGISVDITEKKKLDKLHLDKLYIEKLLAEEQSKHVETFAGALAHELRTPLSSINIGVDALSQCLPTLLSGFQWAQEQGHIDEDQQISLRKLELLDGLCTRLKRQSSYANLFIDMALMNIRQKSIDTEGFMKQSIKLTVDNMLEKYPLDEQEQQQIIWQPESYDDFFYLGDQMLTLHVLFNLLKNALYYIRCRKGAMITIDLVSHEEYNCLHFTDTGPGIPENILPNIFKPFYTKRTSGSGVGLAFCQLVMEAYGGKIACESSEGEYTTFILQFPQLKPQHQEE